METHFAPAGRTNSDTFVSQIESVSNSPIMNKLLEATSGLLIVLNQDRQIVGFNETFLDSLGITDPTEVFGLRLGETLNCIHAGELPHCCGTTPHCVTCGAAIAMMLAISEDKPSEKTCALAVEKNGENLDKYLAIQARPFEVDGMRWILIFAQDITHQHSLTTLENIFFHDFSNLLMVLAASSELLAKQIPDNNLAGRILNASKRLCSEVTLQRFLSEQMIHDHPSSQNRTLEQKWPVGDVTINSDIHLVSRILVNMLLNALESTCDGGTVRLSTVVSDCDITWEVWNDVYILPEVQLRIFQKNFSTKGSMGRGLGTHSMKLLGEKYLLGEVSFNSSLDDGTTFRFKHAVLK
jgi:signal transduction histidine kinase